MTVRAEPTKKAWTEQDLAALAEDGCIHEVVNGELVMSPKNDFYHGQICSRLLAALVEFNRKRRLGVVLDSSTGFWMHNRNCRAPDISFITRARIEALQFNRSKREFFPAAPDLAVEVLSPNNTRRELDDRLKDYFSSGAQIAWIINPEQQSAEVCRSLAKRQLLGPSAFLQGEHLLPGFRYPICDLFKNWDWE